MRAAGLLLMVSGWVLAMAALRLLVSLGGRVGFVLAGVVVEALGLGLVAWSYREMEREEP